MIKSLNKLGTEGVCFNIIKSIYSKFTANVILNEETLKAFSLNSINTIPTYNTFIQHSIESPNQSKQAKEEPKSIHVGKEEVKLSLFAGDMILCIENPSNFTKQLELINEFSKFQNIKPMYRN
jgi:hypothetical protein